MRILDLLDDLAPEPHPELVAATRPTPAQVCDAAARTLGWYPVAPLLHPAVPAERGGV